MKTEKRRLGDIGENVACVFLEKHGFKILDRNYLRKWGELDIVAQKGSLIHFVEVKSVSHVLPAGRQEPIRAEENMHPHKLKRLNEWQLDLVVVKIDEKRRVAKAEMLENIV